MVFRFLEFDLSEDSDGLQSWEALASPAPALTAELLQEVRDVLNRLRKALGPCGAISEGFRWDMDLQIHDDRGQPVDLEHTGPWTERITLALTLSGDASLAAWLEDLH